MSHRFLWDLRLWVGLPQTKITDNHGGRVADRTHCPRHKMIRLTFDEIASMSLLSMQLASALSLVLFGVFVGYLVYVLIHHFFLAGERVPEWSSLMSAITIFGTIQLLLLGALGEYLGCIYEQVKQRPLYLAQEVKRPRIADEAPRLSLTVAGPESDVGAFVGRIVL